VGEDSGWWMDPSIRSIIRHNPNRNHGLRHQVDNYESKW